MANQDLRARKRAATRLAISNAASELFLAFGFEQVTVDDIATAANVGRMTVFNYFPRKEDMFYDRDGEVRTLLCDAVRSRGSLTPAQALRDLAYQLVASASPVVEFSPRSQAFMAAIGASETLKARARAIRDELAADLTPLLDEAGLPEPALSAALLTATFTSAMVEAHRCFAETEDSQKAGGRFLAVVDVGIK